MLATRCIGRAGSPHGPGARPARGPARTTRVGAGAGAPLRPLDRVLLARHPPADLPGARPDGGRRLADRGRGRADRPAGQEGVRRLAGRAAGPGRLAGRGDRRRAAAQRAGRQDPRGVVRRDGRRAPCATLVERHLGEHHARLAAYQQMAPSSTPTPTGSPAPTSTASSSCAAGCGSRSSGSAG